MLSGSGHIAGMINPPAANKYGYWTNDKLPAEPGGVVRGRPADTRARGGTTGTHGSTPLAGPQVPARVPGKGRLKVHRGRARQLRPHARRRASADRPDGTRTGCVGHVLPHATVDQVPTTTFRRMLAAPSRLRRGAADAHRRLRRRPAPTAASCRPIRYVEQKGEGTGLGAVAGGVVGGVIGHQIGSGRGNTVATIAGAGGGAYAGHQVEKNAKKKTYWSVELRMDGGQTRTLHLQQPSPTVKEGERVKLVDGGKRLALVAN